MLSMKTEMTFWNRPVADRLTLRLDELSGLPKEDLLVGIDDTSNKQWLQSKAALKDPGVRKYAAR